LSRGNCIHLNIQRKICTYHSEGPSARDELGLLPDAAADANVGAICVDGRLEELLGTRAVGEEGKTDSEGTENSWSVGRLKGMVQEFAIDTVDVRRWKCGTEHWFELSYWITLFGWRNSYHVIDGDTFPRPILISSTVFTSNATPLKRVV
jgi:hypothetical protein